MLTMWVGRFLWRPWTVGWRLPPLLAVLLVVACATPPAPPTDPAADAGPTEQYQIGPLDNLRIFVWRAEDLSAEVPVRPDGRISLPLVGEMVAAGKTPEELSLEITEALRAYVQNPVVSVIVTGFGAVGGQTVRVVGETGAPATIPYRTGMTALDAMIAVGGLSEFAAGNDARLIRGLGDAKDVYSLRLEDLLSRGDVSANVRLLPGDIILVPKGYL
jgi:polysaccharide export outer membrane protein